MEHPLDSADSFTIDPTLLDCKALRHELSLSEPILPNGNTDITPTSVAEFMDGIDVLSCDGFRFLEPLSSLDVCQNIASITGPDGLPGSALEPQNFKPNGPGDPLWSEYRGTITRLYWVEDMKLPDLMKIMKSRHRFSAR